MNFARVAEFLTLGCYRLLRLFKPHIDPNKPNAVKKQILVIRTDLIGDFFCWLPAGKALRQHFPADQYDLTLVVNQVCGDIAQQVLEPQRLLTVDSHRLIEDRSYRFGIIQQLQDRLYDLVINTHYARDWATDIIAFAVGGKKKVAHTGNLANINGLIRQLTNFFYHQRTAPETTEPLDERRRNLVMAEFLGAKQPGNLIVTVRGNTKEKLPKAYYMIAPGASLSRRRWPAKSFATVIQKVNQSHPELTPVIIPGPGEKDLCHAIASRVADIKVIIPDPMPLMQYAAWVKKAQFLLANDSGPAHMGATLGTRTIVILGGGNEHRFFPYNTADGQTDPKTLVAHQPMPCYGCLWRCQLEPEGQGTFPCIAAVTPDQVEALL